MDFFNKFFLKKSKTSHSHNEKEEKKQEFSLLKHAKEEINKNGLFKVYYIYVCCYLSNGGDAFVRDENGNTLAHVYPELSEKLVKAGCDFNLENNEGYTPVMYAAMRNMLTIDMINASSKETLNKVYPNGETVLTAFFSKAISVDEKILKALLEKGVDVNRKNEAGKSPLDCRRYGFEEILPLLISYGLDIQKSKIKDKPLLSYVLLEMPDLFLELKDADLTQKDEEGNTLLHLWATHLNCCRGGIYAFKNLNILQNLLSNIDINAQNNVGETALISALKKGKYYESYFVHGESHFSNSTREREASLLIEKGADVEKMDSYGNTPLHYAAKGNLTEIVHLLIKRGANVYTLNEKGEKASDLAIGLTQEYLKLVEISEEFKEYQKWCLIKKSVSPPMNQSQRMKD
ncbi:MAG: ankyrin repeat domain-containing protein [Alphaproteobacteria bacterium]|nr:ankyrin repeat domain-containing protein [Alphaproteobacteria bacterium]